MADEIDFDETIQRIQRPDVLIKGDTGVVHVIGLKKPFERDLRNVGSTAKDCAAETYAMALKGYCVENDIEKTKEGMKQKFLASLEE